MITFEDIAKAACLAAIFAAIWCGGLPYVAVYILKGVAQ